MGSGGGMEEDGAIVVDGSEEVVGGGDCGLPSCFFNFPQCSRPP